MQLEVYNPEAGLENNILSKGIYRISYNFIIIYSITIIIMIISLESFNYKS